MSIMGMETMKVSYGWRVDQSGHPNWYCAVWMRQMAHCNLVDQWPRLFGIGDKISSE